MSIKEDRRQVHIVDAIADGADVRWSEAADGSDPESSGEELAALQAIDAIARFHRRDIVEVAYPQVATEPSTDVPADPRPEPDLSDGESWGPLIVLDRIDGGSFGDVFRAWDPALAKIVALKRSRYSSAADAVRAAKEAQRLAHIPPHPNVITVHGACNVNGVVGIWMEFLRGRTLQRIVGDEGELGWVEAVHYGECLCRALAHIHGARLLHRDVKAANVMKAVGGRIVLIDFGSGGDIAPLAASAPDRIVGTLPYMAPELFAGKPATPQSDIYSLGVLLFNLVTSTYPISGASRRDFEAAHRSGRRLLLSDVRSDLPVPFVQIVERAIAPAPDQRYRTAGEMMRDLVASTAPLPTAVDAGRPSAPPSKATQLIGAAAGIVGGFTFLGMVSSRYFNAALGRSDFVNEGVWDWLYWGAVCSVAPAVLALVTLIALALSTECWRLLVERAAGARAIHEKAVALARRLHLDDVSFVASIALVGSALALLGAWWYFAFRNPIIFKFIGVYPDVSMAAGSDLAFLSPRYSPDYFLYRKGFTGVILACVVLWYPVIRMAVQKRQPLNRWPVIGGAAVLLLSLVFLDFPYRLGAAKWREFQEVKWRQTSCFILGERQLDLLLFCPEAPPPRNKVVRKNDSNLEETHERKDIFAKADQLQ